MAKKQGRLNKMTYVELATIVGTGIAVVGFIYMIMRNAKNDVNSRIDRLDGKIEKLEDRMFYLATGKTLADAIKEERLGKL